MHVSIPLFFVSVQFPGGYNSLGWCFSSAFICLFFFSYLWDVRLAKKQVSIVASALLLLGVHQIYFSPF